MSRDLSLHPCFNRSSSGSCGRVHLPVAPRCNIQCGYCNRKYDCVNESRPGVTSAVLGPEAAVRYMEAVLEREPRITVAGIAGPGDPMATPDETLTTLRLLKERFPQLLFCLSSNGLALPAHAEALAEVGVTHCTVTINAVDPAVAAPIYTWARDGKVIYRGRHAAEVLIERQLESIRRLKALGLVVKANTIVIPGINDRHVAEVARAVAALGADLHNLIPLHPTAGTPLEGLTEPSRAVMHELREACGVILPQMTHCRRCRADAVGLLGNDLSGEMSGCLQSLARASLSGAPRRPNVAVASMEGLLVNMHLGECHKLQIWGERDGAYVMLEERYTPEPGSPERWAQLAAMLTDCRALLVSALGQNPRKALEASGLAVHEVSGYIPTALDGVYGRADLNGMAAKRKKGAVCCGGGDGGGC